MKPSPSNVLTLTTLIFVVLVCQPASKTQAQGRPISLPPQASEIAQGIYDLGTARDVDGTIVQGLALVHYKKDFVRPDKSGGTKPPRATSCYAFLSPGAAWKVDPEPFVFDQAVLNAGERLGLMGLAISAWEGAAGKKILGDGLVGEVSLSELGTTVNGLNEVTFGRFEDPSIIAMTIVWGIWSGPPAGRQLLEWDMVFGDESWAWWYGEKPRPLTFTDFLSIATHEVGHAMGMDHPSDACTEETMYAYSEWSETKKRDLNAGDIAGIQKLYP